MEKGFLITFEGTDATGKTTLSKNLYDNLLINRFDVTYVSEFPNGYINKLLERDKFLRLNKDYPTPVTETFILIGNLAYNTEVKIRPALRRGKIVICDRYADSLFAHQIPKIQQYYPIPFDNIFNWLRSAISILYQKPDLKIMLSCSLDIIKKRLEERNEHSSKRDLQHLKSTINNFELLREKEKSRIFNMKIIRV